MAPPPIGPNFFIIGAPKCGTTALSEYLREHQQIFMTDPKEPNFFNRDFDYYGYGDPDSIEDYLRLYTRAGPEHLARGEASVWYLLSQVAAERIHAHNPDARLIAMVRNPVEIAHSLHSQLLYVQDEDVDDFEKAWRLQSERKEERRIPAAARQPAFLQYGEVACVSAQLERFLRVFPREQLQVIVFDDFRRDAGAAYRSALAHIGIEDDGRTNFEPVNESKVHRWQWLSGFTLRPPRAAVSVADRFKRLLGIERLYILKRIRSANNEKRKRDRLSPEFADELHRHFEPEVAALSEILGRDLGAWNRGESVEPG